MNKSDCIKIFNAMIRGTPVSFDKLISIYSDYLTESNVENSDKLINLVMQNPQLMQQAIPKIVNYYCKKYTILSVQQAVDNSLFNNLKPILYYE